MPSNNGFFCLGLSTCIYDDVKSAYMGLIWSPSHGRIGLIWRYIGTAVELAHVPHVHKCSGQLENGPQYGHNPTCLTFEGSCI